MRKLTKDELLALELIAFTSGWGFYFQMITEERPGIRNWRARLAQKRVLWALHTGALTIEVEDVSIEDIARIMGLNDEEWEEYE